MNKKKKNVTNKIDSRQQEAGLNGRKKYLNRPNILINRANKSDSRHTSNVRHNANNDSISFTTSYQYKN